jgi:polygalacturonase
MFTSRNQSKVAIRGRGILCGRKALEHRQRGSLIRLDSGEDLYVEGIIIRESAEWSLNIRNAQNVHVDNVKVVGHYVNNDGIAIGGTSDAVVENSFCHNADDAFEIKVWQRQKNVLFRNCVAWATVAGAFGVCGEVMADLSQVVFEDCTVLHATSANTARGVIGLHLVWGTGSVEDVIFRNVVIEQVVGKRHCPIKVFNNWDSWNVNRPTLADDPHTLLNPPPRRDRPGRIRRIEFHNISVLETENPEVVVYANGPESPIEDIIFDRVSIAGENLRAGSPLIKTNRWVSGVTVK